MSGVGEIIGVTACVAAIVSAYKDGREVVSKIRDKRQLRLAPPPARILDESLDEAARDIELEKSRGMTRLGMTFERGDGIAIGQLRQIQIELEASLFRQLAQALRDDNIVDFGPALEASDLGRDHTLTALMQLRQRLMAAAPIPALAWGGSTNNSTMQTTTPGAVKAFSNPFISPPQVARQQSRPSFHLPIPAAENDYLGFCKGAWKLQCGAPDGLKRKLEFNSGWSSSEVPYLACGSSKCAFAYRLDLDQINRVWHSKKGISFRWGFLAKSHVEQDRVSNGRYNYQCMFCALTGEKMAVWQSVDPLLEHVASHRGQGLPAEILHRTRCIDDRVAEEEEEFDINLHPLGKVIPEPREDSMFEMEGNPWS